MAKTLENLPLQGTSKLSIKHEKLRAYRFRSKNLRRPLTVLGKGQIDFLMHSYRKILRSQFLENLKVDHIGTNTLLNQEYGNVSMTRLVAVL